MNIKKIIYALFSLGITAAIFSYLLTYVSVGDVIEIIRSVSWNFLAIFVILSLAGSLCRTWRYQTVLKVAGHSPATLPLFLTTLIRNLFADLLPARLGDLVYIYIGTTRLGIPFGSAASSFALAFLFDILALVPLVAFALWSIQGASIQGHMAATPFIIGGVILSAVTIAIIAFLPSLVKFATKFIKSISFLPKKWISKINTGLESIINSLELAKKAGIYGRLLFLSVLVRLAKYSSYYVFLCGMLVPLGYNLQQMPFAKAFLGMFASELAASLPFSGFAGFGVYEGTWALTFELLGLPGSDAKLTAVSHHLFTQVYGYLLGIAALLILLLPFFKHEATSKESKNIDFEPSSLFYKKTLSLIVLVLLIIFFLSRSPSLNAEKANPIISEIPSASDLNTQNEIKSKFSGKIVFDSNRSGTFGIYAMNPDASELSKVVDSDWQDRYPDPSPDGKWIVYARSHTNFRLAPSEIWIVDRDGKVAKRLNENGNFPTFSRDGKTIYFERERKSVISINLDGTNETKIFPLKRGNYKNGAVIKPSISPDGKWLAFTSDKPDRWNTWLANLETGEATFTIRGCEASFWNDGKNLSYINKSTALSKSGIYSIELETKQVSTLQDAGEPRGHEYFPTISPDGKFLLYAASLVTQHDHETSNYEIYIKDLESAVVARLTFDGYTNRWPKFLKN